MVTNEQLTEEHLKEMYTDKKFSLLKIRKKTGLSRMQIQDLVARYGLTRNGKRKNWGLVVRPNGYTTFNSKPYHRYIWEQAHGPIPRGWIIHHINGNQKDNRLENLLAVPRDKHKTAYIVEAVMKRINDLEKENNELKDLVSVYEDYISKMVT